MRNGIVFRLAPLALLTGGIASGLWPTPDAHAGTRFGQHPERINPARSFTINDAVRMWPTPHGFSQDGKSNGLSGNELGRAVNRSLWPTPSARDWKGAPSSLATLPSYNSRPLNEVVRFWPTPKAQDGAKGAVSSTPCTQRRVEEGRANLAEAITTAQGGGSLNPTWVEWLMGFPSEWTALEPSATPSSRKSPK